MLNCKGITLMCDIFAMSGVVNEWVATLSFSMQQPQWGGGGGGGLLV